jgi:hypothetical protein
MELTMQSEWFFYVNSTVFFYEEKCLERKVRRIEQPTRSNGSRSVSLKVENELSPVERSWLLPQIKTAGLLSP